MRASAAARSIVPEFLAPGDPVIVAAPSGVADRLRTAAGAAYLASRGHPVRFTPHVLSRHGYLAGRDDERAGDLNAAIVSSAGEPIVFARGGYGLTRILDRIDIRALRLRPRLILGYSDATALFMSLQRQGPYLVLHGPMLQDLGNPQAFDEGSLWAALRGDPAAFSVRFRARDVLRPGRGTGRLLGGCLSLLVSLLGTAHDPDYRGAILFWEEVGEEPYRIDRMLTQLRNAGKFDHLTGMVVGALAGCEPAPGRPSLTVGRILAELTRDARFPIVRGLPAGHGPGKITLPLGLPAVLDTRRRGLEILRPQSRK